MTYASVNGRTGKDTGLGHFPSHDYKVNEAWLDASMTACILLAWLRLLALDGDLAKAEPKTLRRPAHRRPARARRAAAMAENRRILALGRGDYHRLAADRRASASTLTSMTASQRARKETPGPVEPPATRPTTGPPSYPDTKIWPQNTARYAASAQRQPSTPMKDQG